MKNKRRKYLIVDDNALFREYLKEMLLQCNGEVYELGDGTNVTTYYAKIHPDFVLLDIQMKPIDGFTTIQRLKQRFPDARFIIVSNYDDEKYRAKANALGAYAFIAKDNLHELELLLRKL